MGCIVSAQAEPQGVVPRRQSTKKNVVQPHGDASAGSGSPSPSDAKLLEEYSRSEAVTTKLADLLTHRASKVRAQRQRDPVAWRAGQTAGFYTRCFDDRAGTSARLLLHRWREHR